MQGGTMTTLPIPLSEDDLDQVSGGIAKPVGFTQEEFDKLAALQGQLSGNMGNNLEFLHKVAMEQAQTQRQNEMTERLIAREDAKANLLNQANDMKSAADQMTSGAVTSMVMSVISAATSIQGAGLGKFAGGMGESGLHGKTEMADQLHGMMKQSGIDPTQLGQLVNSAGGDKAFASMVGAQMQADAKHAEADGQRDAAAAQYAQQTGDAHKQVQDAMKDMMTQIITFIKDMQKAEVEQMRALTKV
jgi:hypothetical protein